MHKIFKFSLFIPGTLLGVLIAPPLGYEYLQNAHDWFFPQNIETVFEEENAFGCRSCENLSPEFFDLIKNENYQAAQQILLKNIGGNRLNLAALYHFLGEGKARNKVLDDFLLNLNKKSKIKLSAMLFDLRHPLLCAYDDKISTQKESDDHLLFMNALCAVLKDDEAGFTSAQHAIQNKELRQILSFAFSDAEGRLALAKQSLQTNETEQAECISQNKSSCYPAFSEERRLQFLKEKAEQPSSPRNWQSMYVKALMDAGDADAVSAFLAQSNANWDKNLIQKLKPKEPDNPYLLKIVPR